MVTKINQQERGHSRKVVPFPEEGNVQSWWNWPQPRISLPRKGLLKEKRKTIIIAGIETRGAADKIEFRKVHCKGKKTNRRKKKVLASLLKTKVFGSGNSGGWKSCHAQSKLFGKAKRKTEGKRGLARTSGRECGLLLSKKREVNRWGCRAVLIRLHCKDSSTLGKEKRGGGGVGFR